MSGLAAFWRENGATIIVLASLLVAYMVLRSSPTDIVSVEALEQSLGQGESAIIYFYSNT